MKARIVYTVIREEEDATSAQDALVRASGVFDEAGEYLYGGGGISDERIGVAVQVSEDGQTWTTVSEQAPR